LSYTNRWRTTMSITSTRKVSSSPNSSTRTEYARRSGDGENFVEVIDTTNNVWVNNNAAEEQEKQQNSQFNKKEEKNHSKEITATGKTYIPNAIEALTASGVYDEEPPKKRPHGNHKIGIYNNNQSIVTGDTEEQYSHRYLKHFYERNEIIEEVDELV